MNKDSWEKTKSYIDSRFEDVYKKAYNRGFNDGAEHQRTIMEKLLGDTRSHVAYEKMKKK